MITKQDHHISQIRSIPRIGEVTIVFHDRLQRRNKVRPSLISAVNPDQQPRPKSPNPSLFNRFGNQDLNKNTPYEKKFPTSNNCNRPNVVRFNTTEINELSELCPLNY